MFPRPNRLIIPEYAAPKNLSLLAAAELLGEGKRAVAAQIVGLAVKKALTLSPVAGKGKKKGFVLTLANFNGLSADELDTMQALFPRGVVGETITLKPGKNAELNYKLKYAHGLAVARMVEAGLVRPRRFFERTFSRGSAQPVFPLPASDKTVDHLWGLRDYISLAEKDRLTFLQSPSGAQLRHDVSIDAQVLVLNEKLLPYAVLFGLEKEWVRELGANYESLSAGDLESLELLGDVLVFALDPDVWAGLAALSDLAGLLFGVGRIVGGIFIFLVKLAN